MSVIQVRSSLGIFTPKNPILVHPLYRFLTCQFALSMVLLSTSPLYCKKSSTHPPLDTHLSMLHPHIHPRVCRQSIHPSRNSSPVLLFIHTAAFFVKGWFCHSCRHCTARSVDFHPHYSSTPHSTSIYLYAFIYIQVNISSIHERIRRSSSVANLASMSVSALVSLSTVQLSLCVSPAVLQAVQHSSSLDVLSSTIDFIYLSSRIHPRALSLR
jgi:hypothetical protein